MPLSEPQLKACAEQNIEPTPAALRKLINDLFDQFQEAKQVAIILGVSAKSVRYWMIEMGLKSPQERGREQRAKIVAEKELEKKEFWRNRAAAGAICALTRENLKKEKRK